MKNDSIVEAYIEMLSEMPMIKHSDTHEVIAAGAKPIRDYIKNNHHNATQFDKNNHYYHLKHGDADLYYRHDGNNIRELSYISKNIQAGVEKGTAGDSNHIHNFLLHHLENNDSVESSNSNTNGSKKMWINFIKNNTHLQHSAFNRKR